MPLTLAQDAIALLIDLAEQGEIDPWDVKVIEVIDRFLSQLIPVASTDQEAYEASLSSSGQAFLYASMLVLLKANTLSQAEETTASLDSLENLEFLEAADFSGTSLPPFLERQLRRRAVAQPPKRRQVTLKELIDQLQTIADALSEESPRPRRMRRSRAMPRSQAIRTIAQLAHQENLSEMAVILDQFLTEHWVEFNPSEGWLDFEFLLDLWSQTSHAMQQTEGAAQDGRDRVGIFWALLLLASQSKVELVQQAFYQDLKVRILTDPAAPPADRAGNDQKTEGSVNG